jgi:hypothetical protein
LSHPEGRIGPLIGQLAGGEHDRFDRPGASNTLDQAIVARRRCGTDDDLAPDSMRDDDPWIEHSLDVRLHAAPRRFRIAIVANLYHHAAAGTVPRPADGLRKLAGKIELCGELCRRGRLGDIAVGGDDMLAPTPAQPGAVYSGKRIDRQRASDDNINPCCDNTVDGAEVDGREIVERIGRDHAQRRGRHEA